MFQQVIYHNCTSLWLNACFHFDKIVKLNTALTVKNYYCYGKNQM